MQRFDEFVHLYIKQIKFFYHIYSNFTNDRIMKLDLLKQSRGLIRDRLPKWKGGSGGINIVFVKISNKKYKKLFL